MAFLAQRMKSTAANQPDDIGLHGLAVLQHHAQVCVVFLHAHTVHLCTAQVMKALWTLIDDADRQSIQSYDVG